MACRPEAILNPGSARDFGCGARAPEPQRAAASRLSGFNSAHSRLHRRSVGNLLLRAVAGPVSGRPGPHHPGSAAPERNPGRAFRRKNSRPAPAFAAGDHGRAAGRAGAAAGRARASRRGPPKAGAGGQHAGRGTRNPHRVDGATRCRAGQVGGGRRRQNALPDGPPAPPCFRLSAPERIKPAQARRYPVPQPVSGPPSAGASHRRGSLSGALRRGAAERASGAGRRGVSGAQGRLHLIGSTTLYVLLVVFIATLIRSAFGFGEALIAVPLLALFLPITVAAPVAVLLSITIAAVVVAQDWKKIHLRSTGWLVGFTLLGIPLGLLLLTRVHEDAVKAV